ncbi:DUF2946 family protein [Xanthomonas maliensis]|uniref:DUF2946 family protein n=1 Tax=Xanthomonas maliensis TaxID=1321368 RepID=UPI00138AF39D
MHLRSHPFTGVLRGLAVLAALLLAAAPAVSHWLAAAPTAAWAGPLCSAHAAGHALPSAGWPSAPAADHHHDHRLPSAEACAYCVLASGLLTPPLGRWQPLAPSSMVLRAPARPGAVFPCAGNPAHRPRGPPAATSLLSLRRPRPTAPHLFWNDHACLSFPFSPGASGPGLRCLRAATRTGHCATARRSAHPGHRPRRRRPPGDAAGHQQHRFGAGPAPDRHARQHQRAHARATGRSWRCQPQ